MFCQHTPVQSKRCQESPTNDNTTAKVRSDVDPFSKGYTFQRFYWDLTRVYPIAWKRIYISGGTVLHLKGAPYNSTGGASGSARPLSVGRSHSVLVTISLPTEWVPFVR